MGSGVEEVGGDPEDGPVFDVIAADGGRPLRLDEAYESAVLGIVRMHRLFALASVRIDKLAATAIHQDGELLQFVVVQILTEFVNVGRDENTEYVDVLVLNGDGGPAACFEAVVAKPAGRHVDIPNYHIC